MTIQFRSIAKHPPMAQSVTLRTILAIFEATGDERELTVNLSRFMVARAIVAGRGAL